MHSPYVSLESYLSAFTVIGSFGARAEVFIQSINWAICISHQLNWPLFAIVSSKLHELYIVKFVRLRVSTVDEIPQPKLSYIGRMEEVSNNSL